jgi:hypothetical protein
VGLVLAGNYLNEDTGKSIETKVKSLILTNYFLIEHFCGCALHKKRAGITAGVFS